MSKFQCIRCDEYTDNPDAHFLEKHNSKEENLRLPYSSIMGTFKLISSDRYSRAGLSKAEPVAEGEQADLFEEPTVVTTKEKP